MEWLGARYTHPEPVRDADAVYRPDVVMWLELPSGVLLSTLLLDPRKATPFGDTLERTMNELAGGPSPRPSRIRVPNEQLALELRRAAANIPVVVAPVPELDDVFAQLVKRTSESLEAGDDEVSSDRMGELFAAAEVLFRAAPWRKVLDQHILGVDIPAYGIEGACLSVIGAAKESSGLLLFRSLDDFYHFGTPRPSDGQAVVRALSFEPKKNVPPRSLRWIERHRWRVAGPRAYPDVLTLDAAMQRLTPADRDVRILTACARAYASYFARHGNPYIGHDLGPVRESFTGTDGVTVTLTAPFGEMECVDDDFDFDFDETPPPAPPPPPRAGRNDPCPCGSGKKYKKCHLDGDQAPRRAVSEIETVHQMDFRLVKAMSRFASARFGPDWLGLDLDDEDDDSLDILLPWATWTAGTRIVDAFVEANERRMPADERAWCIAQRDAWLSVWEVTHVEPGRIGVRDLLTGEERSVRDDLASRGVLVRDTLLTRVIDYRGGAYFAGMHTAPLPPSDAATVVESVRRQLCARKDDRIAPERLRDAKIGRFLIDLWTDVVFEGEEAASIPPVLRNTDGDPLLFVTDSFGFHPEDRAEVAKRLAAMDGEPMSAEEQALTRDFKEAHYHDWLDTPLPALGGKTPREAARSARSREQLDLLLREMEHHENHLPAKSRYDMTRLRRALGLEP